MRGRGRWPPAALAEARRGDPRADAEALLRALRAGGGVPAGDSRLLDPEQRDVARHEVEAMFGLEFAARLAELPDPRLEIAKALERLGVGHAPGLSASCQRCAAGRWSKKRLAFSS